MRLLRTETYAFLKSAKTISSVMEDLDSHRFPVLPRIHKSGKITFTDGTLNPVTDGNNGSSHTPADASDAITGVKLDLSRTFTVQYCAVEDTFLLIKACLRFPVEFQEEETHGFAALTVDQLFELQGETRGNGACRDFVLQQTKSMIFPPLDEPLSCPIAELVPIKREYTLYVDYKGQLRYLGHAGDKNLENQPILRQVKSLALEGALSPHLPLMNLNARIELFGGRKKTFSFIHMLGRLEHLNFILNP